MKDSIKLELLNSLLKSEDADYSIYMDSSK